MDVTQETAEQLAKVLLDHTKALWANTAAMRDLQRAIQQMPSSMKVRW